MVVSISRSLWSYRGFIGGSVKREFQSKYANSLLGAAWTVLNPLAMVIVYTVVFVEVMRARLPGVDSNLAYSIYLCSGVFTWGLFAEILSRTQAVFIDNANLIKKVNFPRICLPAIVIFNACLNFAIVFGLFLAFLALTGNLPGLPIVSLFPVLVIEILFSVGLGVVVGVLNVFFRDVGYFFTILLQFWFWFTPIVYPMSIVPDSVRPFFAFNPLVPIIGAYQKVFVTGEWPEWSTLVYPLVAALVLCALGLALYRRNVGDMVDEL